MIIEDFVCLGRTVPEQSKTYGHRVCMAGFSPELGQLLRVYPLPVVNTLRVGRRYVLSLQRNSKDSRHESWKLADRIALYESTEKVLTHAITEHLEHYISPSIQHLNEQRASLGIIKADHVQCEFRRRESVKAPEQLELFESTDTCFGANAIHVAPYVRFDDEAGSHCLQLREWGCYEWIRKHPAQYRQLSQNLGFGEPSSQLMLVGNMCNFRNVWLVIKTWPIAKPALQLALC